MNTYTGIRTTKGKYIQYKLQLWFLIMIPFHSFHISLFLLSKLLQWISHACSLFVAPSFVVNLSTSLFSHWLELNSSCPYYTSSKSMQHQVVGKKLEYVALTFICSFSFEFFYVQAATNVSSFFYAYTHEHRPSYIIKLTTFFVLYQNEMS